MTREPPPTPIHSWQDAEHNAATWMRYWGYRDAAAVPGGPDAGIDVRGAGAVAQVKWQSVAVGRPLLQQLVGASDRPGDKLAFFTASNYSAAAVEYAEARQIALFTHGPWGQMEPVNASARVSATTRDEPGGKPRAETGGRDWRTLLKVLGFLFVIGPIVGLAGIDDNDTPLWLDLLLFPVVLLLAWTLDFICFLIAGWRPKQMGSKPDTET